MAEKLTQLAARINAHLERIEVNPELNPEVFYESRGERRSGGRRFYNAGAYQGGRYVRVIYVSYQGASSLTRPEAERYLAWLDEGNVGPHYEAFRDA